MHDEHTLTDRVLYRRKPETSGRLQLQWQWPNQDPMVVDVPLNTGTDGTILRLPWLAAALIRNGRSLDASLTGTGRIIFEGMHGERATSPLSITADTLRGARSQRVWRAPDQRWPRSLQVRLSLNQTRPNPTRPELPVSLIMQRLLARQIPVVARDESLAHIIDTQRRQLTPAYRDTAPSVGHLTGATVLLHIATERQPQGWTVTTTAVDIESGQILGMMTLEDQPEHWGRLMESLSSLLPDLVAPDTTRREGWFIQ